METLQNFNWVDILVVLMFMRTASNGFRTGFSVEIFKALGTLSGLYIAMHYYTVFSDMLRAQFSFSRVAPLDFLDFVCFLFASTAGYLIFLLLRITCCKFIKTEAVSQLNRWSGLIVGILRGVLFNGLIIYGLVISSTSYFRNQVAESFSGHYMFKVAPAVYGWLYNYLMPKVTADEKFNSTVTETEKSFYKKR